MLCGGTQHWKSPSVSSKAYLDVICWWWVDWMASGEWWWCASEYYEPSQCVLSATTANNSSVCNLWNYRKSNLPTRRRRQTTDPPTIDRWTSFKSDHYNLCAPCEWTHPTPSLYYFCTLCGGGHFTVQVSIAVIIAVVMHQFKSSSRECGAPTAI